MSDPNEMFDEGYDSGFSDGYDEGYEDGRIAGYAQRIEDEDDE